MRDFFLPRANAGITQRIILLSGDGGIVDAVNVLMFSRSSSYAPPIISLLPFGTGNALAHSSGITQDSTFGLSTLARGKPQRLPLLKATFSPGARLLEDEGTTAETLPHSMSSTTPEGRQTIVPSIYGAVVASWGLHAALVADSDTSEYRKHGVERFQMAAKENLYPPNGSLPHEYRATVSVLRTPAANAGEEVWEPIPRS
ncbi:hypothetical protein LTS18_013802, partial [Coniosporium uncinatum]